MQFIQLAFLVLLAFARRGHAWSVFILDCLVHLFRSELLSAFKGDFSLFYVNVAKTIAKHVAQTQLGGPRRAFSFRK